VDDARWEAFNRKQEAVLMEQQRLAAIWLTPDNQAGTSLRQEPGISLSRESKALDLLKRPELDYEALMQVEGIGPGVGEPAVAEQVEVQVKYAGYLQRQAGEIERNRRNENRVIPVDFDYSSVRGLSAEVLEKLLEAKPETIGRASRIPGMTPAAISLLLVHLKKEGKDRQVA
jgi:tRNA uridine 5-carboxymethylaminomethyl modification enzyme